MAPPRSPEDPRDRILRRYGIKSAKPPAVTPIPHIPSVGELQQEARQPQSTLQWALDILSRPAYGVAGLIQRGPSGAWKGITGERRVWPSEAMGMQGGVAAFGVDIVMDPLTWVSGGTGGLLRGGAKAGVKATTLRLTREGTKHLAGESARIANQSIRLAGVKTATSAMLKEAQTTAHVSLLQAVAAGEPWATRLVAKPGMKLSVPILREAIGEPRILGGLDAKAMKALGRVAAPVLRPIGKAIATPFGKLKSAFVKPTTMGIEGIPFDELEQAARTQKIYNASNVLERAKKLRAAAQQLPVDDVNAILRLGNEGVMQDVRTLIKVPDIVAARNLERKLYRLERTIRKTAGQYRAREIAKLRQQLTGIQRGRTQAAKSKTESLKLSQILESKIRRIEGPERVKAIQAAKTQIQAIKKTVESMPRPKKETAASWKATVAKDIRDSKVERLVANRQLLDDPLWQRVQKSGISMSDLPTEIKESQIPKHLRRRAPKPIKAMPYRPIQALGSPARERAARSLKRQFQRPAGLRLDEIGDELLSREKGFETSGEELNPASRAIGWIEDMSHLQKELKHQRLSDIDDFLKSAEGTATIASQAKYLADEAHKSAIARFVAEGGQELRSEGAKAIRRLRGDVQKLGSGKIRPEAIEKLVAQARELREAEQNLMRSAEIAQKAATVPKETLLKAEIAKFIEGKKLPPEIEAMSAEAKEIRKGLKKAPPMREEVAISRKHIIPWDKIPESAKPLVAELRKMFDDIADWDKHLPENLQYAEMENYLSHIATPEAKKIMGEQQATNAYRELSKIFGTRMGYKESRTFLGTIDDMNTWFREGLLSGKIKTQTPMTKDQIMKFKFFVDDPVEIALRRSLASIKAVGNHEFALGTIAHFATAKVPDGVVATEKQVQQVLKQNPGFAAYAPPDGVYVHVFPRSITERLIAVNATDQAVNAIPDIEARIAKIPKGVRGTEERVRELIANVPGAAPWKYEDNIYIMPREVAEFMSKRVNLSPGDYDEIQNIFDKATSWWKMSATGIRPAFHFRNALSNVWNNFLAGLTNPQRYAEATAIQKGMPISIDIGGIAMDGQEIYQLAREHGITGRGFLADELHVNAKLALEGTGPKDWWKVWDHQRFGPAVAGRFIGTAIEDNARLALFIDQLKKGKGVDEATRTVMKFLFDYSDLTHFEKTVMRRVFPFYTWSKKNIPLQLSSIIDQPGKYTAILKAKDHIEGTDKGIPPEQLPSFIRDQFGIKIDKDEDGNYGYFLLGGWLPAADISRMDPESIWNMLHPAAKELVEQTFNYTLWAKKPIAAFPGQKVAFLGADMDARSVHFLRNLVFLNEVDRIFHRGKQGGAWEKIVDTFVKTYPIHPLRAKKAYYYQLGELLQRFRKSEATGKGVLKEGTLEELRKRIEETVEKQKGIKGEIRGADPEFLRRKAK